MTTKKTTRRNQKRGEARMSDEGEGLDIKMELIGLKSSPKGLWREMATALITLITEADAQTNRCQGMEEKVFIFVMCVFRQIRDARTLNKLNAIMKKCGLMERWEKVKAAN